MLRGCLGGAPGVAVVSRDIMGAWTSGSMEPDESLPRGAVLAFCRAVIACLLSLVRVSSLLEPCREGLSGFVCICFVSVSLKDGHSVSWRGWDGLAPPHSWEWTAGPSSRLRLRRGAVLASLPHAIWCPCPKCARRAEPPWTGKRPPVPAGGQLLMSAPPRTGRWVTRDSATWVAKTPHPVFLRLIEEFLVSFI